MATKGGSDPNVRREVDEIDRAVKIAVVIGSDVGNEIGRLVVANALAFDFKVSSRLHWNRLPVWIVSPL